MGHLRDPRPGTYRHGPPGHRFCGAKRRPRHATASAAGAGDHGVVRAADQPRHARLGGYLGSHARRPERRSFRHVQWRDDVSLRPRRPNRNRPFATDRCGRSERGGGACRVPRRHRRWLSRHSGRADARAQAHRAIGLAGRYHDLAVHATRASLPAPQHIGNASADSASGVSKDDAIGRTGGAGRGQVHRRHGGPRDAGIGAGNPGGSPGSCRICPKVDSRRDVPAGTSRYVSGAAGSLRQRFRFKLTQAVERLDVGPQGRRRSITGAETSP